MQSRQIHIGQRYEIDVKGTVFAATVRSKAPRLIAITPDNPKRITWRNVPPQMFRRKLKLA